MTKKTFKLDASQTKPLVPGVGGCLATDAVTVEGLPVGFMYRMPPTEEADTGWTVLSGTESDEHLANQEHFDIHDVNTIANCDAAIIPFLHHPPGSAFPSSYGFVVADSGHLSLSIYFDDEASAVTARALWESVRPRSAGGA